MMGSESRNENRAAEAQPAGGGDRDAGPGDPGLERGGLGQAEEQPAAHGEVLQAAVARAPPVHDVEEDAERREHRGHEPRRPQPLLDELLEGRPHRRPWDRPHREGPGEALVDRGDRPASDGAEPGGQVPGHVAAEEGQGAGEGAEVEGDVERLGEPGVGEPPPAEEPGDQDQVARARDRGELRHALRDPQHDGLQDAQRAPPWAAFPGCYRAARRPHGGGPGGGPPVPRGARPAAPSPAAGSAGWPGRPIVPAPEGVDTGDGRPLASSGGAWTASR
jgi:hypothetical protein